MKFSELKFEKMGSTFGVDGIQAIVDLGNGCKASVVRHEFSYGGREGLYEIGFFGPSGDLEEVPEWGDQVNGCLTEEDVEKEIKFLKESVNEQTRWVRYLAWMV
jgi:hypothetical protein